MSQREAKMLYEGFLKTEELFYLFPGLTGDWNKDKSKFITLYTKINGGLNDDIDLDDNNDDDDLLYDDFMEFY